MAEIKTLKQEMIYYDKNGRKIKILKKDHNGYQRTFFKSIDGRVVLDLNAKTVVSVLTSNNTREIVQEAQSERVFKKYFNKILKCSKDPKVKKIIHLLNILAVVLLINMSIKNILLNETTNRFIKHLIVNYSGETVACFNGTESMPAASVKPYNDTITFIHFIINIMRGLVAAACALIMANTGLKIVTEENCDGQRETKKSLQKIFWALFLVFVGTGIAEFIGKRILSGQM